MGVSLLYDTNWYIRSKKDHQWSRTIDPNIYGFKS